MQKFFLTSIAIGFLLILMGSCKKSAAGSVLTPFPFNDSTANNNTYMALGDSYTIGQGVQAFESFPFKTISILRSKGIKINDPLIIAQTGWTTTNLTNAIISQNPKGPFSVVSLLIGVNDQYQLHDTSGYRQRFYSLIQTSIYFAGGNRDRVFVLSIPDYSVTPFVRYNPMTVKTEIEWFNEINRQVTVDNGCTWINITPSTQMAATDPTLLASDSLHPSGKEYTKWSNELASKMQSVLQ